MGLSFIFLGLLVTFVHSERNYTSPATKPYTGVTVKQVKPVPVTYNTTGGIVTQPMGKVQAVQGGLRCYNCSNYHNEEPVVCKSITQGCSSCGVTTYTVDYSKNRVQFCHVQGKETATDKWCKMGIFGKCKTSYCDEDYCNASFSPSLLLPILTSISVVLFQLLL